MELDAHDAAAYARERVKQLRGDYETTDAAKKALLIRIHETWPLSAKKRELRHRLIQALLGKPITSQNELKWNETRTLLEVLNDSDFGRSCWEELQACVEGTYFTEPWNFPGTRLV